MKQARIAVILSGCGHLDGAEIHEATLTLLAIHRNGAEYMCYAPDINQHHVINHLTGEEMKGSRNILIESARIARGKVADLSSFKADEYDALILPGGFGAAKNLSNYALAGPDCRVQDDVARAVRTMHETGKPIGALCIAPVLLARIIPGVTLTIGQDPSTAENLVLMGARHTPTLQGEITIDREKKVVTTPCYMLDSRVDQIAEGAENLVRAVLQLIG